MKQVLSAWDWPEAVKAVTGEGGLINRTWWVTGASGRTLAVLQELNTRIFVPAVHEDIEAVTARLAERGLRTPRLLRTRAGELWHTEVGGGVYRCLSIVGDRTVHKVADPADAHGAARLVARFHRAVRDLDWDFRSVRAGAHDTPRHMARLREALAAHPGHRLHRDVAALAQEILAGWDAWTGPGALPERVIHGDLKISNIRFEGPEAVALIDLDTLARGTLDVELGDAMRSWCNPAAEDTASATFDLHIFDAAMRGYAEGAEPGGPEDEEWDAIVPGIERICWELSARFAQDALAECYFGWDPRFGTRGDHNLLRARGQAALAASVRDQRDRAARILASARRLPRGVA